MRVLRASVRRSRRSFAITYVLEGNVAALRVPAASGSADPLWQHTCFELFLACAGTSTYHEFNFAPSGEWAAYSFERYREGMRTATHRAHPRICMRRTASQLELDAEVALETLPAGYAHCALDVGISAVIEEATGALSYWALAHPAAKPDFHQRGAFTLVLP